MPSANLPSDVYASFDGEQIKTQFPRDGTFELNLDSALRDELATQSVVAKLASVPSEELPQGDTRKYALGEEVGRGGMGRILQARDNDLNRQVAMKVLLTEEGKAAHLRRFIEEAQITGQLEHPNVLPVHDFGINSDGDLFFTMQYVRGNATLRSVIDRMRAKDPEAYAQFTFERRVQIIQQVCHALHYAHLRGLVHRDLKPDNIMIGSCGEVFLVDWGVAKVVAESEESESPGAIPIETLRKADVHKTQHGVWIGTPRYMAPEQVLGLVDEISAQTDIYALSAVLYEFLCLHHYLGEWTGQVNDLMAGIVHRQPRDAETYLDELNGRVPRSLSRICRKGLAKRKDDRYASAQELESDLQLWVEGRAPILCPGTFIQRNLSRWSAWIDLHPTLVPALSIVLVLLVLSLAALGVGLALRL